MIRRSGAALAVLAAVMMLLGGCGVPLQEAAEPLPSGALPKSSVAASSTPSASEVNIFFVSGRELQPVTESLSDRSAAGVMAALAAGPPPDRAQDLRTLLVEPLSGAPVLVVDSVTPDGQAELRSSNAFALVPAPDQVLVVGQVVSTLAEVGVTSVRVTDPAGNTLALALPEGVSKDGPVTAEDYASLVR